MSSTSQVAKCRFCGQLFRFYMFTAADQSGCPACVAKADANMQSDKPMALGVGIASESWTLTMDGLRDLMAAFSREARLAGCYIQFDAWRKADTWTGYMHDHESNGGCIAWAEDSDHAECAIELLFEWLILEDGS